VPESYKFWSWLGFVIAMVASVACVIGAPIGCYWGFFAPVETPVSPLQPMVGGFSFIICMAMMETAVDGIRRRKLRN